MAKNRNLAEKEGMYKKKLDLEGKGGFLREKRGKACERQCNFRENRRFGGTRRTGGKEVILEGEVVFER